MPFRAKREIKGQFQVLSSSPSMCLGTRESEVFPITVFGEVTERQPQSGGYGKFSNAPGLCSEITTNTEHLCMYLELQIFQGSTEMLGTRRKNIC